MSVKEDLDMPTATPDEKSIQVSPFHKITIPDHTDFADAVSRTDSPRAVAPKIKKGSTSCDGVNATSERGPPSRRGRKAKNLGKKKTLEKHTSCVEKSVDLTVDGKMANGTTQSSDEVTSIGENDLKSETVSEPDTTSEYSGDTCDVDKLSESKKKTACGEVVTDAKEQQQTGCESATTRRCTSVPASGSRQRGSRRQAEQSHKITEYFAIRRSSRMTGTELKKQQQNDIQESIRSNKHDGLKVVEIPEKGRGVVATWPFTKGDFVVEYAGDLVDLGIAKQREKDYSGKLHVGCYMYYFQHKNKNYCVDATAESGLLGRLVNHSRLKFNCTTKVVEVDGNPRLILVAARDIRDGEELLYDYGDRSKESLEAYPWLAS